MTLESTVAALKAHPFFQVFTDEQMRLIAFGAETLRMRPGELLYRAGEEAASAFLIRSGAIELAVSHDASSRPQTIVRDGVLLGARALICPTERPTFARAVAETELIGITRPLVHRVLEEFPDAAERLHAALARDLSAYVSDLSSAEQALMPE